ncbi:MAG: hypothetical protein ABJ275_00625 [Maricaulaceae bacterium]
MKHIGSIVLWLCTFIYMPSYSYASELKSFTAINYKTDRKIGDVKDINTLKIRCLETKTRGVESRAGLLSLKTEFKNLEHYDVAITTGHGLIDKTGQLRENCTVIAHGQDDRDILKIIFANDYMSASTNDWALIVFPKFESVNVVRYTTPSFFDIEKFETLADLNTDVLFAQAKGLFAGHQTCQILPREKGGFYDEKYAGILSHNCKAFPGQSGSPVSSKIEGQDVLLGIHLGQSYALHNRTSSPTKQYGYFRIFDDRMLGEVSKKLLEFDGNTYRR